MPNWCNNYLQIQTKTEKQFTKVIQGITNNSEQPFDFNRVIPMPEELSKTNAPNRENAQEMKDKYGYPDWYEFRVVEWGTKWNASDVELNLESPTSLSISFNTAWSPPLPVIQKIAEKYPFASISLEYTEEGMGFYGELEYENGELVSQDEGEITCEWRIKKWGECYDECENCGTCDCDCGCESLTSQTICSYCNEGQHNEKEKENDNEQKDTEEKSSFISTEESD